MTRDDMPDKDITLGEVYRAVLSLKDEFSQTRRELIDNYKAVSEDVTKHAMALAEERIKRQAYEAAMRVLESDQKALEASHKALEARLNTVEALPVQSASSDPWARVGAALSALGTGAAWWLFKGGG